ncbi:MAG: NAD(P)-dependent oxidoreductase [Vulcanimicrobiaceae bacterium]
MAIVTWYGTGLMGSGFVDALCRRGARVTVHNRTFAKAQALEAVGARAVADPREAARGAQRVHLMLNDDASVDALLETIVPALDPGTIVVDHTTVAPRPTIARFEAMQARGIGFVHAPVFMSPQATRDATGVMLVSGARSVFESLRGELEQMTGHLWYVGERPEKAAALKLAGNEMLFFITAGLADAYATAKGAGLDARETFELFEHFKPGIAIDMRGKMMAEGDFAARFELTMARKDARLMLETAAAGGETLHALPAIVARMDALIAAGHGGDDMAVLGIETAPGAAAAKA